MSCIKQTSREHRLYAQNDHAEALLNILDLWKRIPNTKSPYQSPPVPSFAGETESVYGPLKGYRRCKHVKVMWCQKCQDFDLHASIEMNEN